MSYFDEIFFKVKKKVSSLKNNINVDSWLPLENWTTWHIGAMFRLTIWHAPFSWNTCPPSCHSLYLAPLSPWSTGWVSGVILDCKYAVILLVAVLKRKRSNCVLMPLLKVGQWKRFQEDQGFPWHTVLGFLSGFQDIEVLCLKYPMIRRKPFQLYYEHIHHLSCGHLL